MDELDIVRFYRVNGLDYREIIDKFYNRPFVFAGSFLILDCDKRSRTYRSEDSSTRVQFRDWSDASIKIVSNEDFLIGGAKCKIERLLEISLEEVDSSKI
jgi:hypothetical protein